MCHIADLKRYGAQMETWTAERITILLAIRTVCRRGFRWLPRRWGGDDQLGSLRAELFQVEGRRPVPPR